jgi:outer membrane protein OmpA-like peptidoglycan-associated protein
VQAPALKRSTARASAWRGVFLFCLLVLIGLVAFGITQLNQSRGPRWNSEELTPKKYLTSWEEEKETLAQRLKNDNPDSSTPNPEPAVDADPRPEGSQRHDRAGQAEPPSAASLPVDPSQGQTDHSGAEIAPLPLMKEKIMVHFSLNSNEIEPKSYDILDRIAVYLKDHPGEIIAVRGYTDASGSSGYNASISGFRANAVKSYLLGKGAPADNIRIFAMGADNPIGPNDTTGGRTMNRRVEIEFVLNNKTVQ